MVQTTYSTEFKEAATRKALLRGQRTVGEVAGELNISIHTLKHWLRDPRMAHLRSSPLGEKRATDWTAEQRLQALFETYPLSDEARNAWCRERGLFAHQLAGWKKALLTSPKVPADVAQLRQLKNENTALRRDLNRKDKALSEAAALLVLQKKYQALWEDEDK